MDDLVILVPGETGWKAYSRHRLIAQHTLRIECERRAMFLGWKVVNPTYAGPLQPLAEADFGRVHV